MFSNFFENRAAYEIMWPNVAGRGLVCHRLDTTWAKVLILCYQTTTEGDL